MKKQIYNKLNNIFIEVQEKGFTVWVRDGSSQYWLLDGSMIREDGEVRINSGMPKLKGRHYKVQYKKDENVLKVDGC